MPNLDNQSSSPDSSQGGNGVTGVKQPEQVAKTKPPYPSKRYVLEDFSQQRINRGQQQINYWVVEVHETIIKALNQLKIAVSVGANNGTVDLGPVEAAINEVSEAANKVAGEFPPGCGDPV